MKTVEPRLRYTRGREEAFLVSGLTQGKDCRKGSPGESRDINQKQIRNMYFVYREYYYVPPFYNVV